MQISFYMKLSTIEPFKGSKQGISVYMCLVGYPSTGKSPAMRLINDAVTALEQFREIAREYSPLTNAATTEALVELLSRIRFLLGNKIKI